VLGCLNGLKPDKGNLHGEYGSDNIDGRVGDINSVGEPPADHQYKDVQRDQVDEKHIATPGGDLKTRFYIKLSRS
jgi:hypothetical protein